jgi:sulfide dehydrogenase cytochrome subunit
VILFGLTSWQPAFYDPEAKYRKKNDFSADCETGEDMRRILPPAFALLACAVFLPGVAAAQAPLAAEGCLGCHGPNGTGAGAVPALAGRDAAEIRAAMAAFRANERPATIMGRVARGYTEAEIAALADHFGRLPR